ncbi:MAG: carbohydrate-binding family 9-like protein [Planctomycetes bacterium]|nr:carbohydrate-binding family 9-like protein [Planctomycetota bacterium]
MTQPDASPAFRPLPTAIALAVWLALTLGHKLGLEFAGNFFAWAKTPGNLHAAGGEAGMARAELFLAVFFGSIALAVVALVGRRLRGQPRERLIEAAIPWIAWAAMLVVIWKCFIVYATELVHFGQYALVGALVCWAIRGGRNPQLAFLITFALGTVDELYQHYVLAAGNYYHWMDWSDLVLDGLGATGGILPFVTLLRLELPAAELPDSRRLLKRTLIGCAVVLLPLTLLDPLQVVRLLGHYRYYPAWGEYPNFKPTHWPAPGIGIPLVLASIYVLGTLLEPRRRGVSQPGLAALLILGALAIQPLGRKDGMPVHEVVPTVVARPTPGVVVDGVLDEPCWASAARLGPFARLRDGKPASQATYARVTYDGTNLYVAFEAEDSDVWARETQRDDPYLPGDEVLELFVDDGGDEVTYFEFELSPHQVVYDLLCLVAHAPVDFNPDLPILNHGNWDARDLQVAVKVDGTLDLRPWTDFANTQLDQDRGWTAELAIPWKNFATTINYAPHRPIPPVAGDRWRLGLYRVERPRVDPAELAEVAGQVLDVPAALERLAALSERIRRDDFAPTQATLEAWVASGSLLPVEAERDASGQLQPVSAWATPPAQWTFRAEDLLPRMRQEEAEVHAWSPTYDATTHRPQFFGVLEFGGEQAAQ